MFQQSLNPWAHCTNIDENFVLIHLWTPGERHGMRYQFRRLEPNLDKLSWLMEEEPLAFLPRETNHTYITDGFGCSIKGVPDGCKP